MFSLLTQPTTARRSSDFASLSRRLDEFYRRDFTAIGQLIKDLFPSSWDRRLQRDVALVAHFATSQAIWYTRPPSRTWRTADGAELSEGLRASLGRLYAGLKIDLSMAQLNEMLVVQHTVIGVVVPRPGTDALSLRLFSPYEVECDPDPVASTSVSAAREFRFRCPIDATHDSIQYGILRFNKADNVAVYEHGSGTTGVFNEEGTLPGGEYPIFVARLGPPPKSGDFFCSLPGDLADAQCTLSLALSDCDTVARFSAWGQKVMTNATKSQMESVVLGPDTILGLEDDQNMAILSASTGLSEYMETIEQYLKHWSITSDLSAARWEKGNALTGLSKRMSLYDRDTARRSQINALTAAETSLYNAIRVAKNYQARAEVYPPAFVDISHIEPPLPADALQDAQARRLLFEDGISTPADHVALERNISIEEAEKIVEANVAKYAEHRAAMAPPVSP